MSDRLTIHWPSEDDRKLLLASSCDKGICNKMLGMIDAAIQREARLKLALVNARHIIRVENLAEDWPENVRIIDEALTSEYRGNEK